MKLLKSVTASVAAVTLLTGVSHAATVWATQIDVGFNGQAGWDAEEQTFTTERDNPGDALGAPDAPITDADGNSVEGGFYGPEGATGSAIVFGFGGTAITNSITIHEATFGKCDEESCTGKEESADIYAFSGDYIPFDFDFDVDDLTDLGFVKIGDVTNAQASGPDGYTMGITGTYTYFALRDTSAAGTELYFDTDSFGGEPVPVPAAGLLFGAGLAGLTARRRARKVA